MTAAHKSSYSATLLAGSLASGKKLPEHFQLPTDATETDQTKIPIDFIADMHDTVAQYHGTVEPQRYSNTYGMNEKGGMNKEEFGNYMLNSLRRCFPSSADIDGKRVLVLVDGGPGRTNEEMLEALRLLGILLFPSGPPNTTHILQVQDMLYGMLKTVFFSNLENLYEFRLNSTEGQRATITKNDIGVLLYGGKKASEDGAPILRNAVAEAFSVERIQHAWGGKLGVYPKFNRAALSSKKIQHELIESEDGRPDDDADPMASYNKKLSDLNKLSCDILNAAGYNGNLLRMELPSRSLSLRREQLTLPHTRERQDAIAEAKSQGHLFTKTGGQTLNNDDFFISVERSRLIESLDAIKAAKKEREAAVKRQDIALRILEAEKTKHNSDDLKHLIAWKTGKPCPAKIKSAAERLALWNSVKDKNTPAAAPWTKEEETELLSVESKVDTLTIEDTGLA